MDFPGSLLIKPGYKTVCCVFLLLVITTLTQPFFVDIIRDEVGEEDAPVPNVWYRKRVREPNVPLAEQSDDDGMFEWPQANQVIKRQGSGMWPVTFFCIRKTAFCRNGGQGPKVNYTKKRYSKCVCLCPASFRGPQCTRGSRKRGFFPYI